MDQLSRNFPGSKYQSRVDRIRPEIEAGMKASLAKAVVQLSYPVAGDLLQQRLSRKIPVDERNNIVPAIPGKQVTTRHNQVLRGTLERVESNGDMVLQCKDTTVTIAAKEIMMVQDVNLAVAYKYVNPLFEDLKDYVTDLNRPDGLKKEMIASIAQKLKQPEAAVQEIFEKRLAVQAVINDQGQVTKTPTYATVHDSAYGRGSWLREGSKPAALTPFDAGRPQRRIGQPANAQPQPDPNANPDLTDDPEVWWKYQHAETQLAALRAMAAEKLFSATASSDACPNCQGAGAISVTGGGGNLEPHRCPYCRGIGKLYKVTYK
jgi:hypothetical protein